MPKTSLNTQEKQAKWAKMLGLEGLFDPKALKLKPMPVDSGSDSNCYALKNISSLNNSNNSNKDNKKTRIESVKNEKYIPDEYAQERAKMWRRVSDCPVMQAVVALGFEFKVLVKRCMELGFEAVYKACDLTLKKPDSYFRQGVDLAKQRIYVLAGTIRNMAAKLTSKLQPAQAPAALPEAIDPKPPVDDESKPLHADPQLDQAMREVKKQVGIGKYRAYLATAQWTREAGKVSLTAPAPITQAIRARFLKPLQDALESVFLCPQVLNLIEI